MSHRPISRRSLLGAFALLCAAPVLLLACGKGASPEKLWEAVEGGDADGVRAQLEGGVLADSANPKGMMPLEFAVAKAYAEVVEVLAKGGADVNRTRSRGRTSLHRAVEERCLPCVESLLAHGARVDVAGGADKRTALHLAARRGVVPIVRALLKGGANVNKTCADGNETALHIAAKTGRREVAQALLDAGADRGAASDRGTPAEAARSAGHAELATLLEGEGGE